MPPAHVDLEKNSNIVVVQSLNLKGKHMKKQELGRSMVEMLSVLAIIGLLSIGGYAGYSLSIKRIGYEKILDTAINFAGQGTGGKSYTSLAGAGMDMVHNIDMALSESGMVCLKNAGTNVDMGAFRSYASQYVRNNKSVTVKGQQINCVLTLQLGRGNN